MVKSIEWDDTGAAARPRLEADPTYEWEGYATLQA